MKYDETFIRPNTDEQSANFLRCYFHSECFEAHIVIVWSAHNNYLHNALYCTITTISNV